MSKEKSALKSSGEDSQAINLKNLVESIVELTVNQRFNSLSEDRARVALGVFVAQINEANTIEEVSASFRELMCSWRSDPYLFCNADVMNSILNLIEESIGADAELRQIIEDIESWLNKNYIYSQSVASQQSQGSVHEGEVHHLSQILRSQSLTQKDSKASEEDNNQLYAVDYLADLPEVSHQQHLSATNNPQPDIHAVLSQGSQQSNNSYDVDSQESFFPYAQVTPPQVIPANQQAYYDSFPNAQPQSWEFNLTQSTNASHGTQGTNVDSYKDGETDQEGETQPINFCSNLIYNNLPDDIYNKAISNEKNDFESNDIVNLDFKFYDFSVITSLLAILSLSLSVEMVHTD